jgi:hypothetical protein
MQALALLKYWKLIVGGVLTVAFVGMFIALKVEHRHNVKLQVQIERLNDLRAQDRANYEAAAKAAEAEQNARLTRVKSQQEQVTHEVTTDYQRQLADLRARFLRAKPKADPGVSPGATVSGVPNAAPGADDSTRDDLRPSERQLAAEISLRLRYLQEWVRKQVETR